MAKLSEILKKDAITVGQTCRGICKGVGYGVFSPFLLSTAKKQLYQNWRDMDKSVAENVSQTLTQIFVGAGGGVALGGYAFKQNLELEYFIALGATNVIDYIIHAIKRSKK